MEVRIYGKEAIDNAEVVQEIGYYSRCLEPIGKSLNLDSSIVKDATYEARITTPLSGTPSTMYVRTSSNAGGVEYENLPWNGSPVERVVHSCDGCQPPTPNPGDCTGCYASVRVKLCGNHRPGQYIALWLGS